MTGRRPISLVLPSLAHGGAELVVLTLAEELAARGHRVDLVTIAEAGPLADRVGGATLVDLGAGQVRHGLAPLVRYLRAARPRVVMATLVHAEVLTVLAARVARTGAPVIARVASTLTAARAEAGRTDRAVLALARHAYPLASQVIAPSRGVVDDLLAFTGRDLGAAVLHNPIVGPRLREQAAEDVPHPWFLPGAPPVVLAAGRLTPAKDLPVLLRAFAAVRQQRPAKLVVLGEGAERPALTALISQLGLDDDVDLPGWEPNPFRYMARCSAYALSSTREGSPASLVQAMACGAPVVSTDCPSGPREVLDGGRFGALVPVGDVAGLAAALGEAIDRGRRPPPVAAWAPYTVANAVDAYEVLFDRLAAQTPTSTRST